MNDINKIVKQNLELMNSGAEGGMIKLFVNESINLNSRWKGRPCSVLNFYYDENGKIIKFTNKDIPNLREFYQGAFQIASDIQTDKHGIVAIAGTSGCPRFSLIALTATVMDYNKQQGWALSGDPAIKNINKFLGQK